MKRGGGNKHDDEGEIRLFRTTRAKFTRWMTIRGAASVKLVTSGTQTPLCRGKLEESAPGGGLRSVSWGVVGYGGYNSGEA